MKRKPCDEAYRLLFGSPRIACQLLHSFVDILRPAAHRQILHLRFGLEEGEKNLIRNIQEPGLQDSALDAFATGKL